MRTSMGNTVVVLCIVPLLLASCGVLKGDAIRYEVSGLASGSFGGTSFSNELVTISALGDTEDIDNMGSVHLLVDNLIVTAEVAGIGSAEFTDVVQVVSNNNSTLGGFGNVTSNFGLFFVLNDAFETYDLSTDLGPVTGTAIFTFGVANQTANGALIISSSDGPAQFQAQIVPEPSALILLLLTASLATTCRRR